MTPNDLLAEVKVRFSILLHDDEKALQSLLKQAVSKYQELAGFPSKCRISQGQLNERNGIALPELFGARLACKDSQGHFVMCEQWQNELEFRVLDDTEFPITLVYLEDALNADFDKYQLPANCISVLGDYLELLIRVPNSERERRVAMSGKLDTSDIPVEADLNTRKTEIESQMRLNRAVLQPISLG